MCARLLKPDNGRKKNIVFRYINIFLARGNRTYEKMIKKSLTVPKRVFAGLGIIVIGIWLLNYAVPGSFLPEEDQGYFTVELELPEGATLQRTREVTDRAIASWPAPTSNTCRASQGRVPEWERANRAAS